MTKKEQPDIEDIENTINNPDNSFLNKGDFSGLVISTGSTLLDLSISANRIRGGGIPPGVIMEIFGKSQSGKTAVLAEIAASCKFHGGVIKYQDPEARLDTAYAEQCGLIIDPGEYNRPDTVEDLEEEFLSWTPAPKKEGAICVQLTDALGALSTVQEMEKGDKMAAPRRAKMFNELLRKVGRIIAHKGWVIACSNHEQIDINSGAVTTPGGTAFKFWSSIRIRINKAYKNGEIKKTWKIPSGSTVEKVIGIKSIARVIKSVDDPFHEVPVFIIFRQGIDDVRGNLTWIKEILKEPHFDCINETFKRIDPAIRYIEENNRESELREKVIDLWGKIEDHFKQERKPKVRF